MRGRRPPTGGPTPSSNEPKMKIRAEPAAPESANHAALRHEQLLRKSAEEAESRARGERFRRYFELGVIGMAITLPNKGSLEVNDELCRMLGYDRSELLRKNWAEMTHPDDLAADLAQFNRVLAGEIDGYTLDKRWIRGDGRVIDSITAAKCVRRADGSLDYVVSLVQDITERKRAEADLRRREANLADGQRISRTGSWSWNASTKEIYSSQELLRIFGLEGTAAPLMIETFVQTIHAEDRDRIQRAIDCAIEKRTDFEAEYRIVLAGGAVRHIYILAHPIFDNAGTLVEYVGTAMDLTERKRAEEKLAESERRFRLLVESIPHHVWSLRPDGTGGYVNQRLIDYTGISLEQLRRGGAWAALHPDDMERVKAAWATAFANGTDYEMEQRVRGRDGRYRRFVCRAVVVRDERGEVVEWFGTDTDVEDRRQAEESLTRARFELARVMRVTTMGELAASIAHELNQPLAAIATSGHAGVRWLSAEPPNLREADEALERIIRDANRAAGIITRIRSFLKRGPERRSEVNLDDLIAEVMVMVQAEIRNRGVSLIVTKSEGLTPAPADRVQLQQVILNLVMNAIDAMSSVKDKARVLEIGTGQHGADMLRVSVSDTGKGIAPAERDRVFEPFHTTKPKGMGMGLAISRSIVEAHGGELWVTPNEGSGETFQFTLPLMRPPS
jgi:PAS domain S-box-containing protein